MTIEIAVFLKAPRPGQVKTRLAAEIGAEAAVALYRAMAERTLAAAATSGLATTVWFAPEDGLADMVAWLGTRWSYIPQTEGDLGERLAGAARSAGGAGWIAVGGDCPGLDATLLRAAADIVGRGRVALGPSLDGGYYLIGAPTPVPDLFSRMPWSTPSLLSATRSRLGALGVPWDELRTLGDVDTRDDAVSLGLLT